MESYAILEYSIRYSDEVSIHLKWYTLNTGKVKMICFFFFLFPTTAMDLDCVAFINRTTNCRKSIGTKRASAKSTHKKETTKWNWLNSEILYLLLNHVFYYSIVLPANNRRIQRIRKKPFLLRVCTQDIRDIEDMEDIQNKLMYEYKILAEDEWNLTKRVHVSLEMGGSPHSIGPKSDIDCFANLSSVGFFSHNLMNTYVSGEFSS